MTSFGDKKLDVVKVVKNLTGASLMDAKKLVEGVPAKIKEKVSKEDAGRSRPNWKRLVRRSRSSSRRTIALRA